LIDQSGQHELIGPGQQFVTLQALQLELCCPVSRFTGQRKLRIHPRHREVSA
jgi:hypothetical protein